MNLKEQWKVISWNLSLTLGYTPLLTGDLGIDDLGDVVEAVWEARAKWYNIGLKLRIPPGTLDSIDMTANQNPDKCFTAVIKEWLNNDKPCPTWAAMSKALRSPMVGYGHLAEQLPPHST